MSWSVKSNGLDFNAVQALAINPNTPATLYGGLTMGSTAPQTGARTGAWSVMGKPFMGLLASRSGLRVFAPVLHVPHRMISRIISKKDQLWFHLRKHIG